MNLLLVHFLQVAVHVSESCSKSDDPNIQLSVCCINLSSTPPEPRDTELIIVKIHNFIEVAEYVVCTYCKYKKLDENQEIVRIVMNRVWHYSPPGALYYYVLSHPKRLADSCNF